MSTNAIHHTDDAGPQDSAGFPPTTPPEPSGQKAATSSAYLRLYRYATPIDGLLYAVGSLAAVAAGAGAPLMTIMIGNLLDSYTEHSIAAASGAEDADAQLRNATAKNVLYYIYLGIGVFAASYFASSLWNCAGARIATRIREEYLAAMLRQDAAWWDKTPAGALLTRMAADVNTLQTGISFKVAGVIQSASAVATGVAIAFARGPRLAAVVLACLPLTAACTLLMARLVHRRAAAAAAFLADAGAVAQEALVAVKTVAAFGVADWAAARYAASLTRAEGEGVRAAVVVGMNAGASQFVLFGMFAVGFYYGSQLVGHGMTAGSVLNTFFGIFVGSISLINIGPAITIMAKAAAVGTEIFQVIDRKSPIDPSSDAGIKLPNIRGVIEFRNVDFHYPQRPDVLVLRNFSLRIEPGTTVGLVGLSGSGKSTLLALLVRLYDPVAGTVSLDGHDVRTLNVSWLRQQFGVVKQEP
ncbi:GTPase-activating protein, partial [Cladochytrium tenue]